MTELLSRAWGGWSRSLRVSCGHFNAIGYRESSRGEGHGWAEPGAGMAELAREHGVETGKGAALL